MNDFKNNSLEHHLVSICALTYNIEAYIKQTLESFLMQSAFFSYEIIIHDDASTDKIKSRYHSNQRWSSIRQSSKVFFDANDWFNLLWIAVKFPISFSEFLIKGRCRVISLVLIEKYI